MAKRRKITSEDLEYMSSLSAATLQKSEKSSRIVLYTAVGLVLWFIVWASFAEIDEITRGEGKIIPSSNIQVIQNLEGGIVEEILVKPGDQVKKGQPLLKIDNKKFISSFGESKLKIAELQAKLIRLDAEAHGKEFKVSKEDLKKIPKKLIKNEKSLYDSNLKQLENKLKGIGEQLNQKRAELNEEKKRLEYLKKSLNFVKREMEVTRPMVEKGIESRVNFMKLEREANDLEEKISSSELTIPKIKSMIDELKTKKVETILAFQNEAKEKWNETNAELDRLKETTIALKDQVSRTLVRSPVDGTIKQIFANTIGGVIKPGEDIIEIVPSGDMLVAEVRIKPQDIAFLYPGQKAIVKFTAYDFSIYGGLDGKVSMISADSILDEKGNSYYEVRVTTEKNYLQKGKEKLTIIPGMTVTVDIITGKKTVLDYLLKPILKAKNNALTER